ncbi:MAG: amidohydrolase [Proteobacteria bacterium]|nr:amidohydrolase [Pseudomonadota bacterium]
MTSTEQLYFGGDIYTVDEACPTAEALAVKDGVIVAVGTEADCRAVLGAGHEAVDLKGSALLPGFIDSHTHPTVMVFYEMNTDLTGVGSLAELQENLGRAAENVTGADWVLGLQFDEQSLDEPKLPGRRDLDAACPDRPAIVLKRDGHMVIANTPALEAAGVSAATDDPEGGKIDRESDGFPAGPFRENAMTIILNAMPVPDMKTIADAAEAVFKRVASFGITSLGAILQTDDEGVSGAQGAFDVSLMELVLDRVPFSLFGLVAAKEIEPVERVRQSALHQPELGQGHRIGALKIWADGTFGSCTALMSQPFTDQPDKSGFLVLPEDEIYRRMVVAHRDGLQIAVHSIGDACTRKCVGLFERLLKEYPREDHRHRIEHASLLDADLIRDLARLGLIVSTQPMFIHSEKDWIRKRLGPERTKWVYPLRSLVDAGVKVACSSDAPIESMDTLHAIQCCVTRDGFEPHQSVTAQEAIRMFTLDAAFAQFEDTVKGSLSVGKRADMVVLDRNPVSVPVDEIKDIQVKRTICGGKPIA